MVCLTDYLLDNSIQMMERTSEVSRLADEFVRESRSIKTKSELFAKLAEY